jgi:hypothetical protein
MPIFLLEKSLFSARIKIRYLSHIRRCIMNKNVTWARLLLLAAVLLGFAVFGAEAAGKGQTARANLKDAEQTARKWRSDSILVGISTMAVEVDGTSEDWAYNFYSPGITKRLIVRWRSGKLRTTESAFGNATDPVGNKFIDSDKAIAEAKKIGLKTKGKPVMGLHVFGSGKYRFASWTIGGTETGDSSIVLDADSGKLYSKSITP